MLELEDRLYTTEEVAKLVNSSKRSIYRYVEEGTLVPETKTAAGTFRFGKKAILGFLYPTDAGPVIGPARNASQGVAGGSSKVLPNSPVLSGTPSAADTRLVVGSKPANFFYFKSSISDLKALAHTIRDKARADSKNYAFTLFAGFSLHKESPVKFSTIHIYVEEGDLEYWKGVLSLFDASKDTSNVCLIADVQSTSDGGAERSGDDPSEVRREATRWSQGSYEINGFKVVADERLKSDLETYSEESKKLVSLL